MTMEDYAIWALVWPILAVLACIASGLAVQGVMVVWEALRDMARAVAYARAVVPRSGSGG